MNFSKVLFEFPTNSIKENSMMKKIVFIAFLISLQGIIFSNDVNWFTSYDKAIQAAEEEGKNILVLITAPSWCYWCVELEKNVLSKVDVKNSIKTYIPLMLLDKVDGKRNPELERFEFGGYPTVRVYDSKGVLVDDVYTQNPDEFKRKLADNENRAGVPKPQLRDLILPEKYTFNKLEGEIINNKDDTWSLIKDGVTYTYLQLKYDYEYIYLGHEDEGSVIALPQSGEESFLGYYKDDVWQWESYYNVVKVGGDSYYKNN